MKLPDLRFNKNCIFVLCHSCVKCFGARCKPEYIMEFRISGECSHYKAESDYWEEFWKARGRVS